MLRQRQPGECEPVRGGFVAGVQERQHLVAQELSPHPTCVVSRRHQVAQEVRGRSIRIVAIVDEAVDKGAQGRSRRPDPTRPWCRDAESERSEGVRDQPVEMFHHTVRPALTRSASSDSNRPPKSVATTISSVSRLHLPQRCRSSPHPATERRIAPRSLNRHLVVQDPARRQRGADESKLPSVQIALTGQQPVGPESPGRARAPSPSCSRRRPVPGPGSRAPGRRSR